MMEIDAITTRLNQLSIDNHSIPGSTTSSVDHLEQAIFQLTLNETTLVSSESQQQAPPHPPTPQPRPPAPPNAPTDNEFAVLWTLDQQLDTHMKSILPSLDALSSPDSSAQAKIEASLAQEKHWLQSCLGDLHGMESHRDPDIRGPWSRYA